MPSTGSTVHRANLYEELVSLKAGEGATYENVLDRTRLIPGLTCVRREIGRLSDDQQHIGVRKAIECAVRQHMRFARHRVVLLYGFNFEGSGGSLEARRIEVEQLLGISESTIKRDETDACKELASVLLALKQSPCAPSPTPGPGAPLDPTLLTAIVEGIVDNRVSAMLRLLGAQTDPIQADAVYRAIFDSGKIAMGLRMIEKLVVAQQRQLAGPALIPELLDYVGGFPDGRIEQSPTRGLAAGDLVWVHRYLQPLGGGFASTIEAAEAAQARVWDQRTAIWRPADSRPTRYYAEFVRNTFNLVAFHLIQEESHGWPLLKAKLGTVRTASSDTNPAIHLDGKQGGAS